MDETSVVAYITQTFPDVETENNFGYTFFFYRSDHKLPFATLISDDTEYDHVSNLDRPGVYRLNIGVGKQTFETLFGTVEVDVGNYDFSELDTIMPHPEYAQYHFICVVSPGERTSGQVRGLLAEAYGIAEQRFTHQHKDR